ncbi:unnamed protein product [Ectocarpus sp. 12 AP-2014]
MTEILPDPIHLTQATLEIPENRQGPIAADLQFRHHSGAEVSAVFDWRHEGEQTWTIEVDTTEGHMVLHDGGARMVVDDKEHVAEGLSLSGEYPRLYARMAELVHKGQSDVDVSPLRHVADAFLLGQRRAVPAFHD